MDWEKVKVSWRVGGNTGEDGLKGLAVVASQEEDGLRGRGDGGDNGLIGG